MLNQAPASVPSCLRQPRRVCGWTPAKSDPLDRGAQRQAVVIGPGLNHQSLPALTQLVRYVLGAAMIVSLRGIKPFHATRGGSLLHHGVRAVLPLHVQERFDPVGEHRVVPPDRDEQGLLVRRLPGGGLPQPADPAHDRAAARGDEPAVVEAAVRAHEQRPGRARGPDPGDRLGQEMRATTAGGGVATAEPGGGPGAPHSGVTGVRRDPPGLGGLADPGDQRMMPAHPGVAECGAFLGQPVGPLGVHPG